MGIEVVVRPVVFPNIRPAPAQPSPPVDDPTKDLAVIHGASGQHIDLPFSFTVSSSTSKSVETQRRFDVARVYQMDDDENVNKDNFVDVNVATKIWMKDGKNDTTYAYSRFKENKNVEMKSRDQMEKAGDVGPAQGGTPDEG